MVVYRVLEYLDIGQIGIGRQFIVELDLLNPTSSHNAGRDSRSSLVALKRQYTSDETRNLAGKRYRSDLERELFKLFHASDHGTDAVDIHRRELSACAGDSLVHSPIV